MRNGTRRQLQEKMSLRGKDQTLPGVRMVKQKGRNILEPI